MPSAVLTTSWYASHRIPGLAGSSCLLVISLRTVSMGSEMVLVHTHRPLSDRCLNTQHTKP
jgi:hypothetical protein